MVGNFELDAFLQKYLNLDKVKDYCPNGLQIEGKKHINKIVTGVSANLDLILESVDRKADAIIVHHGFFWKEEDQKIINWKYNRIMPIIKNDINLFSYHLPLDVHFEIGNNVALAELLNLCPLKKLYSKNQPYGVMCRPRNKITISNLIHTIERRLGRKTLVVGQSKTCDSIAICTGSGQRFIENAYQEGAEVYISGEISEHTTHLAKELGVLYVSAGHHATERYGILKLASLLEKNFEIENPV